MISTSYAVHLVGAAIKMYSFNAKCHATFMHIKKLSKR